jgi:hypothetical protein
MTKLLYKHVGPPISMQIAGIDIELREGDELIQQTQDENSKVWNRCPYCNGTGALEDRYCHCAVGRDLERIESGRFQEPQTGGN